MSWLRRLFLTDDRAGWSERARESILDLNDGIVSAAGVAEGFTTAGASTRALVLAGATVIVAGGSAAAASRYSEERTEWEMVRRLIEEERASLAADPEGELDELTAIYEAKGLETDLARRVAVALSARDPVAAHADAEHDVEREAPARANVLHALNAGLFYALGAAVPLLTIRWLPADERIELAFIPVLLALALTGWFASWLTRLPAQRMVFRNLTLGAGTMAAGLVVGLVIGL
ncbi:MAG TPA: VIT1/CCC1 transporter family protein [Gaiellaceae bacterium]|nr:VIT1/CCC1 transporter family protein [Gaiellaceae bacterium]